MADSVSQVDYVVVGLGALGSAAAWQLARRGHSVVGLDRFALGHDRGASHDTSRILRHSYHTPGYVELTLEAYADWADLEDASGEHLVTTTGGLDLFPPDPAILPDDYTASLDAVGIAYDVLDGAEVSRRWPAFRLPPGTLGALPGGRRDRARRPRHRGDAGPGAAGTAPTCAASSPCSGWSTSATPASRSSTAAGTIRARGVVVTADAWTNQVLGHLDVQVPLEVTWEQVTYFSPDRARAASRRRSCRCGSGWTTRRSTASPRTASRRSRRRRTAAARPSTRTTADRTSPPRGCWPGCTGSWTSCSRAPATRCGPSAASTR